MQRVKRKCGDALIERKSGDSIQSHFEVIIDHIEHLEKLGASLDIDRINVIRMFRDETNRVPVPGMSDILYCGSVVRTVKGDGMPEDSVRIEGDIVAICLWIVRGTQMVSMVSLKFQARMARCEGIFDAELSLLYNGLKDWKRCLEETTPLRCMPKGTYAPIEFSTLTQQLAIDMKKPDSFIREFTKAVAALNSHSCYAIEFTTTEDLYESDSEDEETPIILKRWGNLLTHNERVTYEPVRIQ